MSGYSNYSLHQKYTSVQGQILTLNQQVSNNTNPTLASVLGNSNDAGGLNIQNVGTIDSDLMDTLEIKIYDTSVPRNEKGVIKQDTNGLLITTPGEVNFRLDNDSAFSVIGGNSLNVPLEIDPANDKVAIGGSVDPVGSTLQVYGGIEARTITISDVTGNYSSTYTVASTGESKITAKTGDLILTTTSVTDSVDVTDNTDFKVTNGITEYFKVDKAIGANGKIDMTDTDVNGALVVTGTASTGALTSTSLKNTNNTFSVDSTGILSAVTVNAGGYQTSNATFSVSATGALTASSISNGGNLTFTQTPSFPKLITASTGFEFCENSSTTPFLTLNSSGASNSEVIYTSEGIHAFRCNSNSTNRMFITNNDVQIFNPLTVTGTASTGALTASSISTTGTANTGPLTVTGTASTGALTASSISTTGTANTGPLTVTGTASTGALTASSITTPGTASTGDLTSTSLTSSGSLSFSPSTVGDKILLYDSTYSIGIAGSTAFISSIRNIDFVYRANSSDTSTTPKLRFKIDGTNPRLISNSTNSSVKDGRFEFARDADAATPIAPYATLHSDGNNITILQTASLFLVRTNNQTVNHFMVSGNGNICNVNENIDFEVRDGNGFGVATTSYFKVDKGSTSGVGHTNGHVQMVDTEITDGSFHISSSTGATLRSATGTAQGAYMGWNDNGDGATQFLNSSGTGAGGFKFHNRPTSSGISPIEVVTIGGSNPLSTTEGGIVGHYDNNATLNMYGGLNPITGGNSSGFSGANNYVGQILRIHFTGITPAASTSGLCLIDIDFLAFPSNTAASDPVRLKSKLMLWPYRWYFANNSSGLELNMLTTNYKYNNQIENNNATFHYTTATAAPFGRPYWNLDVVNSNMPDSWLQFSRNRTTGEGTCLIYFHVPNNNVPWQWHMNAKVVDCSELNANGCHVRIYT